MTDDGTLFDADRYGTVKTRRKSVRSEAEVVPWRPGWHRMRSGKGVVPFWHQLADRSKLPDEANFVGTSITLCGIVGGAITHHVDIDGLFMTPCAKCGERPGSRKHRTVDPSTSKAAADAVTDKQTSTQLTKIERIMHAAGRRGLTDEELCRELAPLGWADSGIRTRRQTLSEMAVLTERGLRMSSRGRLARVWVHADHRHAVE